MIYILVSLLFLSFIIILTLIGKISKQGNRVVVAEMLKNEYIKSYAEKDHELELYKKVGETYKTFSDRLSTLRG
jgi:hypothetical protein